MNEKTFQELPVEIREQIKSLLAQGGQESYEEAREVYARIWQTKFELFTAQMRNIEMELIDNLRVDDSRGAILLTYSGSLISLGTAKDKKRWMEYASIKFRSDVPDFIVGENVTLAGPVSQDAIAEFEGSPLKKSSAIYRIAVCPEGTSVGDQENRIKEATIYLTNGFIKINRTAGGQAYAGVEQFNAKSIIAFIAKKNGITQTSARTIIDDYLSMIEAGILLGERVSVGKLGSVTLRKQAARKARVMKNIATGADILIPAKDECLVPKFSVSGALKEKALSVDPAIVAKDGGEGEEEED